MEDLTHRELCKRGARFLKQQGTASWNRPQYVVCELERAGECPDIFGFGGALTQLIEVKVSRADFLADKKKHWRNHPEFGLGQLRSYLCPEGLIKKEELPPKWGLFYINSKRMIWKIVGPELQLSNTSEEMNLAASILRREGIHSKVFSYKKYKNEY